MHLKFFFTSSNGIVQFYRGSILFQHANNTELKENRVHGAHFCWGKQLIYISTGWWLLQSMLPMFSLAWRLTCL